MRHASTQLHNSPSSIARIDYIDALRGIAILGVLFSHVSLLTNQSGYFSIVSQAGNRGVQLFYLVSALTLFMGWHGKRKKERNWLTNFLIRRFFRIAPAFYVALAASLILFGVGVRPDGFTCTWLDVIFGALLAHGFSPSATFSAVSGGWSVGVEVIFYLVLPMMFIRVTSLWRAIALAITSAIGFGVLCRGTLHLELGAEQIVHRLYLVYFSFPVQMPVFCAGISAFFLMRTAMWKKIADRRSVAVVLLMTSIAGMAACLPLDYTLLNLNASFLAVVPLLLSVAIYPLPFLVNRATIFLGKISYSFYLLHFFVIQAFARLFPAPEHGSPARFLGTIIVVGAVSTMLAALSWRLIEEPGIEWGKRIIAKRESRVSDLDDSISGQPSRPIAAA